MNTSTRVWTHRRECEHTSINFHHSNKTEWRHLDMTQTTPRSSSGVTRVIEVRDHNHEVTSCVGYKWPRETNKLVSNDTSDDVARARLIGTKSYWQLWMREMKLERRIYCAFSIRAGLEQAVPIRRQQEGCLWPSEVGWSSLVIPTSQTQRMSKIAKFVVRWTQRLFGESLGVKTIEGLHYI